MEARWKSESQISTQRESEDKRTRSESDLAQTDPEQVMEVLPEYEEVVSEDEESDCKEEVVNLGASYRQCRAAREAKTMQDVAYISYTTETKKERADVVGSMDRALDKDIEKCFHGARIEHGGTTVHQYLSSTFDPATLRCITCEREHGVGGEGECYILTDQNFLASLPGTEDKKCLNIVRIENAGLFELIDIFAEIMANHKILPGTIILLGTLSHLAKVGASIYAGEWRTAVSMLQKRWGGVQVCPLPPLFFSPIPGSLVPDILMIGHWFCKVYEGTTLGLTSTWNHLASSLSDLCQGEICLDIPDLRVYPLPTSLDVNSLITPWRFKSNCSSPVIVFAQDRKAVYEQVHTLAVSLLRDFSFKANPGVILLREPASTASECDKDSQLLNNVILIGGSNLGRMEPAFSHGGINVVNLAQPGWILTEQSVTKIVGELENVLPALVGNTGVVLDVFGNSSVKFKHVDSSLVLPLRVDGKYHLLGEAVIESDEGIQSLLKIATPIFDAISKLPTVVTPPQPRYVFSGCCRDSTHAPNTTDPGYSEGMLNGFSHFRRVLKTELVRSGVMESFWVLDCLAAVGKAPEGMEDKLRSLRECLSADGVHLTNLGYKNLFDSMSSAMYEVRSRRKAGKKQDSASVTVTGGSFYWRGFISKQGSAKRPGSIGSSRRDGGGKSHGFGGSFGGGSRSKGGSRKGPYDRSYRY